MGCLLEAIEQLLKKPHMVGVRGVDEPGWLVAIHRFCEGAVEEGILDVELVYGPGVESSNAEDDADGGRLDYRAEYLVIVDAMPLRVASYNRAPLVVGKRAVGVELVFEDPLGCHNVGTGRTWNETPSVVVE